MSTQLDYPRIRGAGIDQQAGLEGPERDRHVGADRGAGRLAGVGVDPARQVDGHDQRAGAPGRRGQRRSRLAQPAPPADAQQPVDDQVGRGDRLLRDPARGLGQPPAAAEQRGRPALVDALGRGDGGDDRAALGQPGPGVQRVSAVVPAAGEHDHPGPVDASRPAEQAGARRGQAGGGPLHQRAVRQQRHQRALGRPDPGHGVRVPHAGPPCSPRANSHLVPTIMTPSLPCRSGESAATAPETSATLRLGDPGAGRTGQSTGPAGTAGTGRATSAGAHA